MNIILIYGEPGVGKELLGRVIRDGLKPFISSNEVPIVEANFVRALNYKSNDTVAILLTTTKAVKQERKNLSRLGHKIKMEIKVKDCLINKFII